MVCPEEGVVVQLDQAEVEWTQVVVGEEAEAVVDIEIMEVQEITILETDLVTHPEIETH